MTKTVFVLYDHIERAYEAVQDLTGRGVKREQISVITRDPQGQKAQELGIHASSASGELKKPGDEFLQEHHDEDSSVDALFRLLVNVRAPVLPTIGPAIASGPLAAAIGSTQDDGPGGGWVHALRESGVSDEDAQTIHNGIRRGNTLVMVEMMNNESDKPVEILNRHRPAGVNEETDRSGAHGWQGFNEDSEPFAFDRPDHPYKERAPGSRLDFGMGANDYLPGKAIGEYDRLGQTDVSRYTGDDADEWKKYEPQYREHFQQHYADGDKRWDEYRDAYHFGFDLAHLHHATNQTWETLSSYAQQNWASTNIGRDWAEYQDAVRTGWEAARKREIP